MRRAADGGGDAGGVGGASGGNADSADVVESRADVGRLGLGSIVAGVASAEASQAMEGEAVIEADDFGGAGGGDAGAAVVAIGSRADVDQLGLGEVSMTGRAPAGGSFQETQSEAVGGADGFGGGGSGDADTAVNAAGSRADVGRPGPGFRAEARSDAYTLAQYGGRTAF